MVYAHAQVAAANMKTDCSAIEPTLNRHGHTSQDAHDSESDQTAYSETSTRWAWRWIAASTNPENSGWQSVGLERNSGWYCTATNQG